MTDVRCLHGHDGDPCRTCGYASAQTETPPDPDEPGHCERNPDGDLTEGSSSPYHRWTCVACGDNFSEP